MSIGEVSNYSARAGFPLGDKLPCLSKEQRAALIAQFKPLPGVALFPDLLEGAQPSPAPSGQSETTRVSAANGICLAVTQHPVAPLEEGSYTLHLGEEGSQLAIDFSNSLRVGKTEDGLYAVYFTDQDVTRTYAPDGTFNEVAGDRTEAEAGRLFINTTDNETVQGGNGNDTFLIYGANGTINTGPGDNSVIIKAGVNYWRSASCKDLTLGDGNNSVKADRFHGNMTAGDGDNSISIGCLSGSLSLGNGSNRVVVDTMKVASILPGNGDSSFTIGKMGLMSRIMTSPASSSEEARRTFNISSMGRGGYVGLSGGCNALNIGYLGDAAYLAQVGGQLSLDIDQMGGSARMSSQAERASVSIGSLRDQAEVSLCGNSSIQVAEMGGQASLRISDGPGGLRNQLVFDENGELLRSETGACEVFIGKMRDSAKLSLSGSEHMVVVSAMLDEAGLAFGDQDSAQAKVLIGEADDSTGLPREQGNIQVVAELEQERLDEVKAWLDDWRAQREEAGLPANDRDLWAALRGEVGMKEELGERVALLMPWR